MRKPCRRVWSGGWPLQPAHTLCECTGALSYMDRGCPSIVATYKVMRSARGYNLRPHKARRTRNQCGRRWKPNSRHFVRGRAQRAGGEETLHRCRPEVGMPSL